MAEAMAINSVRGQLRSFNDKQSINKYSTRNDVNA